MKRYTICAMKFYLAINKNKMNGSGNSFINEGNSKFEK